MILKAPLFLLFIVLFLLPLTTHAENRYDLIKAHLNKDKLPRLLNTDDIDQLANNQPTPLGSPMGDFNGDGVTDIAITGIYDLALDDRKYFLLVTSLDTNKPTKLFFKEYKNPVFLHTAGETGKADPGDQSFSISFCLDCKLGRDFYWNQKRKRFDEILWKDRFVAGEKTVTVPAENVPDHKVDLALRIVGGLPDIQEYIATLQKENRKFGTRVERDKKSKKERYWVTIFERIEGKEEVYDRLLVDLKKKKLIRRQRS